MGLHAGVCAHIQMSIHACNYKKTYIFYTYGYLFHPDIDECSDKTDGCSQMCTNTNGSFICGCNTGFQLNNDGITCNGMQKH